ncbi:MAG: prepilin-type N-terminal cleavage/methylation domain-containing protein [Candidatus Wallbacteria bacterium]
MIKLYSRTQRLNNSNKMHSTNLAFSLVEILIAITIFAVSLAPLIGIFLQSQRSTESAIDYYRAQNIAISEIERLKALSILHPAVFYKSFPKLRTVTKDFDKYHLVLTVDPEVKISTISSFDNSSVDIYVKEAAAEIFWESRGKKASLLFKTTLR